MIEMSLNEFYFYKKHEVLMFFLNLFKYMYLTNALLMLPFISYLQNILSEYKIMWNL
jgi:hypothetical protein